MPMRSIPAPGYSLISGKRKPPSSWGDELWCQLRSGWCDEFGPWSVRDANWIHSGSNADIIAVRKG